LKKLLFTLLAFCALSSAASAGQTLTVYTYESFVSEWGPGPKVKEAFEKDCSCTLNWVAVTDGVAMLNRLKLEGTGTQADVVLGLDTNLTAEAKATGLFGPHGQDASKLTLPIAWTDDTFLPYDYAHFAVVYDTEKMPQAKAYKSLKDLVESASGEKIILDDPRT